MSGTISLNASATVSSITDGNTYQFPPIAFTTPNVFAKVGFMDSLVVKLCAYAWKEDFRKYAVQELEERQNPLVRPPVTNETFRGIQEALLQFPEFQPLFERDPKSTHFLLVHKLQFQRLQQANLIRVPESRFILLSHRRLFFFDAISPVIVQERVRGVSLLDMFDSVQKHIKPEWRKHLPTITPTLKNLIHSEFCDHLNWFIKNFIFVPESRELWYVDSKPSFLFARLGNDANIEGLQKYFFPYS